MSRVLTNKTALSFAAETSPGVLPGSPVWFRLEPNTIKTFGAVIKTVPRRPISTTRQLRKGTVVDLDSSVEFEHDVTIDAINKLIESFCYSEAVNADVFFTSPAATASPSGFTIPAASAIQAAKLKWVSTGAKAIIYANGYVNPGNNGLKTLAADTGTSGTTINVAGITAEPTPPSNAYVTLAGVQAITGDLAITVSAGVATLTNGNNGVSGGNKLTFNTIGLTPGQFVYLNGFSGAGYFRITQINANSLIGDKVSTALVTDTGAAKTVAMYFGRFIRNVSIDQNAEDNRYVERTFTFEQLLPDLYGFGSPGYQYSPGNYANTLEFNVPLTNKATMSIGLVGFDTANPTNVRATNASTPVLPLGITAFSTAIDIVNLRTNGMAAANTLFKSLSFKINNNASPEKVLASLGALAINVGLLAVEIQAQVIFADPDVIAHIRNNDTITLDILLKNGDGAFAVDIPSLTLAGGGRQYPLDKSVLMDLTGAAFADTTFNTSLGISLFPALP